MTNKPSAVVFDLDGCVWLPEMFELWGGGAPFTDNGDGTLKDKAGRRVYLLGATREALRDLHCSDEWKGTVVAIASRTDEPSWAEACLQQFMIADGKGGTFPMKQAFHVEEIHKGCKTGHLKSIAQRTGIELSKMLVRARDALARATTFCCRCLNSSPAAPRVASRSVLRQRARQLRRRGTSWSNVLLLPSWCDGGGLEEGPRKLPSTHGKDHCSVMARVLL